MIPPNRNVLPGFRPGYQPPIKDINDRIGPPGKRLPGTGPYTPPPLVVPNHWPIHLTAQTLLSPGAQNQSPALQTLRAPAGRWLVVDEIKFEVEMSVLDNLDVPTGTINASSMASMIACSLNLDKQKITNGFVPVSMFGPCQKQTAEKIYFYESANNNDSYREEYSWRPPVPIVVAPNQVLVPAFEHRGFVNYKTRVRVSYSGHLELNKPQDNGLLPYVASWTAPIINLTGTESEMLSTEKDLVNPSKTDVLLVKYMMGRIYVPFQTTDTVSIMEGTNDNYAVPTDVHLATDQTKIKIGTSWGNPVVPEYVTFPAAFDLVNRQIDMEHIVPQEGYFAVGIKSGGVLVPNSQVLAIFSIVGQREVTP